MEPENNITHKISIKFLKILLAMHHKDFWPLTHHFEVRIPGARTPFLHVLTNRFYIAVLIEMTK